MGASTAPAMEVARGSRRGGQTTKRKDLGETSDKLIAMVSGFAFVPGRLSVPQTQASHAACPGEECVDCRKWDRRSNKAFPGFSTPP